MPIQVLTAGLIPMLVEHFSTMINTELRTPPTSFAAATGGGGPAIVATDFASGVDLLWPPASPPPISPPPLFGYDSVWEDDHTVTWPTVTIFIVVANVFGILHNRKLRSNLHNHAMLLRRHAANMDLISSEVIQCQELLANIFPPQVLAQLQNTIPGMDRASPGQSIAERFEDCTFLFAKIVGLKQITEDEERDPHDVVAALQNIFDRYDALTETFKVQKVRKTVNEYYMVAAGLPDRTLIDGRKDRALAIAALSFSMVHVMDIVNTELSEMDIGPHLQCQIGIHSGAAIAGVIGHKRFQYDLCGDAVNTAARMCAYSAPGCINCSEVAHDLLKGEYETIDRGARQVKGKGSMRLYYLVGRTNPTLREQMRLALAAPAVDRERPRPAAAARLARALAGGREDDPAAGAAARRRAAVVDGRQPRAHVGPRPQVSRLEREGVRGRRAQLERQRGRAGAGGGAEERRRDGLAFGGDQLADGRRSVGGGVAAVAARPRSVGRRGGARGEHGSDARRARGDRDRRRRPRPAVAAAGRRDATGGRGAAPPPREHPRERRGGDGGRGGAAGVGGLRQRERARRPLLGLGAAAPPPRVVGRVRARRDLGARARARRRGGATRARRSAGRSWDGRHRNR